MFRAMGRTFVFHYVVREDFNPTARDIGLGDLAQTTEKALYGTIARALDAMDAIKKPRNETYRDIASRRLSLSRNGPWLPAANRQ